MVAGRSPPISDRNAGSAGHRSLEREKSEKPVIVYASSGWLERVRSPGDMTVRMADKTIIALREAAAAYAEAVRTTQRFFDHLEDTDDPSVLIEYATLVEREKEAAEARLDAIEAAGIEAPSIDESDPDN